MFSCKLKKEIKKNNWKKFGIMVTVSVPGSDAITGGGYLKISNSIGTYAEQAEQRPTLDLPWHTLRVDPVRRDNAILL